MASSRSSLASDLHDVGTPAPSSPLPPPDSSTPLPPAEDQDNKQRSHSPTPQPPSSSSQVQEENGETTGATSVSTTAPTNPPEISIQSTEDTTITGVSDTEQGTVAQKLSLSEAGAQVEEASAREEGEGMKEKEVGGKEKGVGEGEEEEAFGDFQGAEGVTSEVPVTSSSVATAVLDSGSSPTEDGEQPQNVLTDATTNLQPTSADFVAGMHMCSSS